jgi:hypothetical protein
VLTVEPPGLKRRSAKLRVEARGADGQPLARVLHAAYIDLQKL